MKRREFLESLAAIVAAAVAGGSGADEIGGWLDDVAGELDAADASDDDSSSSVISTC